MQSFYKTFTPLLVTSKQSIQVNDILKTVFFLLISMRLSFRKNKQEKVSIQTIMKVSHSKKNLRLYSWGYNEYIRLKKYIKMSFFFEVRRYSSLKWKKSFPFFLATTYQKNNKLLNNKMYTLHATGYNKWFTRKTYLERSELSSS